MKVVVIFGCNEEVFVEEELLLGNFVSRQVNEKVRYKNLGMWKENETLSRRSISRARVTWVGSEGERRHDSADIIFVWRLAAKDKDLNNSRTSLRIVKVPKPHTTVTIGPWAVSWALTFTWAQIWEQQDETGRINVKNFNFLSQFEHPLVYLSIWMIQRIMSSELNASI